MSCLFFCPWQIFRDVFWISSTAPSQKTVGGFPPFASLLFGPFFCVVFLVMFSPFLCPTVLTHRRGRKFSSTFAWMCFGCIAICGRCHSMFPVFHVPPLFLMLAKPSQIVLSLFSSFFFYLFFFLLCLLIDLASPLMNIVNASYYTPVRGPPSADVFVSLSPVILGS